MHPQIWEASGHVEHVHRSDGRLSVDQKTFSRRPDRTAERDVYHYTGAKDAASGKESKDRFSVLLPARQTARKRAQNRHAILPGTRHRKMPSSSANAPRRLKNTHAVQSGKRQPADRAAPVQPDVQDLRRPGRERRQRRLSPSRNRPGHLRPIQKRARNVAPESSVRHRADRQSVPQRSHAAQFHLPLARVRADGTGVFHQAGRSRRSALRQCRRRLPDAGHPGEPAAELGLASVASSIGSKSASRFYESIGLPRTSLEEYWQKPEELAHYARATVDILFKFPFGTQELEGIAARGDFDLSQHQKFSGKPMEYFDDELARRVDEAGRRTNNGIAEALSPKQAPRLCSRKASTPAKRPRKRSRRPPVFRAAQPRAITSRT